MAKIRAIIKRPDEKVGHVCNVEGEDFANLPDGYIKTWKKLLQEWGNPI